MANSTITLAQIRTEVKRTVIPAGNLPDGWTTDSTWDLRILAAIREIASKFAIAELEKIATNKVIPTSPNRTIDISDLPLYPLEVLSVKNTATRSAPLDPLSFQEAEDWDEGDSGEPIAFLAYENTIEIYPLASSSYAGNSLRIRYVGIPADITENVASPLPNWFDRAIQDYACYLCLLDQGEPERAKDFFNCYVGQLRDQKPRRTREFRRQRTSLKRTSR